MTIKRAITLYLLTAICAVPITSGMLYRQSEYFWLDAERGYQIERGQWWDKRQRQRLGENVLLGALFAALWPLGVPAVYLTTGFAEHGVFTLHEVEPKETP